MRLRKGGRSRNEWRGLVSETLESIQRLVLKGEVRVSDHGYKMSWRRTGFPPVKWLKEWLVPLWLRITRSIPRARVCWYSRGTGRTGRYMSSGVSPMVVGVRRYWSRPTDRPWNSGKMIC